MRRRRSSWVLWLACFMLIPYPSRVYIANLNIPWGIPGMGGGELDSQAVVADQQGREISGAQRLAEIEPLDGIAAVAAQELTLLAGLHALRHHRHLEILGHADDGDGD